LAVHYLQSRVSRYYQITIAATTSVKIAIGHKLETRAPAPPGSRFDRMIAELARRSANSSTFHRRAGASCREIFLGEIPKTAPRSASGVLDHR
jgi:hypothetical protein